MHFKKALPEHKKKYLDAIHQSFLLYFTKLSPQHILSLWLKDQRVPSAQALEDYFKNKYEFFRPDLAGAKDMISKKKDFIDLFGLYLYAMSYHSHKTFNLLASSFVKLLKQDAALVYERIAQDKNQERHESQESVHSRWFPFFYELHENPQILKLYLSLKSAIEKENGHEVFETVQAIYRVADHWDKSYRAYKGSEFLLHDIEMYLKVYEPILYDKTRQLLEASSTRERLASFSDQSSTVFEAYRRAKRMDRFLEEKQIQQASTPFYEQPHASSASHELYRDTKGHQEYIHGQRQDPNIHDVLKAAYEQAEDITESFESLLEDELPYREPRRSFEKVENLSKMLMWVTDQYLTIKEERDELKDDVIHQKKRIHEFKNDQEKMIQDKVKQAESLFLINMLTSLRNDYPELTSNKDLQSWCKSFHIYPYPQQHKLYDTFSLSKQDFLNDFEDESKQGYQSNREAELLNYGWKLIGQEKPLIKALITWVD